MESLFITKDPTQITREIKYKNRLISQDKQDTALFHQLGYFNLKESFINVKKVTVPFEWFYDPFLPSLSDL